MKTYNELFKTIPFFFFQKRKRKILSIKIHRLTKKRSEEETYLLFKKIKILRILHSLGVLTLTLLILFYTCNFFLAMYLPQSLLPVSLTLFFIFMNEILLVNELFSLCKQSLKTYHHGTTNKNH